jgi:8-oxo-dGTP diphosphatase
MTLHVVAAAIVHDGRVLAARRARPSELAGGWEFPGGKVEPAESERDALARECGEELGIVVRVGERLGEAADGRIRLVLYVGTTDGGGLRPREDHDELRWLSAAELDDIAWLPIDRELLPLVAALLPAVSAGE